MLFRVLGLSLCLAAATLTSAAFAQSDYPARPVTVIVPLPAGSAADGVARVVLPAAEKFLGQGFVIENEGGAASIPGTTRAAQADPDGYTLLWGTVATQAANPNMFNDLPYDPGKDFTAVARTAGQSLFLAVPTASGIESVEQLIAEAKKRGNMTYASAGVGTSAHLNAELFQMAAGIQLRHIPYQAGSQSVLDLMRGEVDMMFYSLSQFQPGLQTGELRLLAVASPERSSFQPDLPTLQELGYQVDFTSWYGLYARAGTPPEDVAKLADAVNKALAEPDVIKALEATGTFAYPTATPAEFEEFTNVQRQRYADLIEARGIPKN
ncbi:MAG TPA: tripartite tricarboxylate transporter substrate binding protein [Devosia sp.]|jgi:tripartite-type tricarboxylate transporter receptor subunit TctC|nr:tripartite tricarboxylate transporter substrate binding protein [Devosia sp.]